MLKRSSTDLSLSRSRKSEREKIKIVAEIMLVAECAVWYSEFFGRIQC